jgi:glycosyltransferase involved in cell wall biosynthesis
MGSPRGTSVRDSIILTVFNRPVHVLANTLRALYQNDLEDTEVIVVDDGSDLETKGFLEILQEEYQFELHDIDTNQRQPDTCNFSGHNNPAYVNNCALELAQGKHITLLSSDCIIPPHAMSKAREYPKAMWVPRVMDMDSGHLWLHRQRFFPMCWFVRAPKHAIEPFDLEYLKGMAFEDNDWTARVALATNTVVLDENVTIFHQSHPMVAYQAKDGTVPTIPVANSQFLTNEGYTHRKWGGVPWQANGADPLFRRFTHEGGVTTAHVRLKRGA